MADLNALSQVFDSFCAFGSNRNLANATQSMEGSKFAKFCRDTNIQSQNITATEVDITFNKVKAKNERRINFEQFKQALQLLAAKKYPSKPASEAFVMIVRLACVQSNGPQTITNVKPANEQITARLTNPDNFTGTQKQKFVSNSNLNTSKTFGSSSSFQSSNRPSIQGNAPLGKRTFSSTITASSDRIGMHF